MSKILGNGQCITYFETEIHCPICTSLMDVSKKMDKAKLPVFDTKCPECKGKITISIPIFGGTLQCWETHCPKTVKRLETSTPNRYNGMIVLDTDPDDDEDDDEAISA